MLPKRRTWPAPPFVGFARKEDRQGRYVQAVLRVGQYDNVVWSCEHRHIRQFAALSCAIQARGQAIAAQLLPEPESRLWTE